MTDKRNISAMRIREFVALQQHSEDELLAIVKLDSDEKYELVMSIQDAGNLAVTIDHALKELGVVVERGTPEE